MPAPLAALAVTAGAKIANGIAGRIAGALGATSPNDAKARKTAEDFETMFLEQSLERLFASEETEGPLGDNGAGGGIYRSMLVKEYASNIAKSGGVGIAEQVYGEILKLQESNHGRS
jgi:peptidoglycan hydrolase FlgJ